MKSSIMSFPVRVLVLTLLAAAPARAWVVDQACTPEIFGEWSALLMSPSGQEFVPALTPLNVVELWISHGGTGPDLPADISVRVRDGSIGGAILGESAPVRIEGELYAAVRFDFAAPVALAAGNTYVLEAVVAPDGGNPMVCGGELPAYGAGRAILVGNPAAVDLWFRTGATEEVPTAVTSWGSIKALYRP